MKKSLLLSIVMTLVLVVAMSTATFAWYTANASVQATAVTVQAETAGSNLLINKENSFPAGTDLTKINLTDVFDADNVVDPIAPKAAVEATGVEFVKAYTENGVNKLSADDVGAYEGRFYLKNDGAESITITVTDAIDGDLKDHLAWVLLFDLATDVVVTNGYNTVSEAEGVVSASTPVESNESTTITIPANTVVTVDLIIWIDGTEVNNANQSQLGSVAFTFAK